MLSYIGDSFLAIESRRQQQSIPNSCPQHSPRLPGEMLKLPEGHNAHAPAEDPPQPLRYRPAAHPAAAQRRVGGGEPGATAT